jgi:spindle assembly abnormal protein 6
MPASDRKPLMEKTNQTSKLMMEEQRLPVAFSYETPLKVLVKAPDREGWIAILTVRIEAKTLGRSGQGYVIELTDDNDFLFLYSLECSEADFLAIKAEQRLVFDFQMFPHRLIEQLELRAKPNELPEENPKACILELGFQDVAVFKLIEYTNFNELNHLVLKLKKADDEYAKQHLANKLNEFKNENIDLKKRLQSTEDSLNLQVNTSEKLKIELRAEREESERREEAIKLDAQRQFNDLQQQALEKLENCNTSYSLENKKTKETLEEQIAELNKKLGLSMADNSELTSKVLKLEATERELTAKTEKQAHELELYLNELELLRGTNKDLDTTKFSQERNLVELRVRCETMQKQMDDKEQLVQNANSLSEATKARCEQLEETISILNKNAAKMEEKLIMSANEINKGNDIIKQLQADLKATKQKTKLKEGVCADQEKLIEQNKKNIEDLNRSYNDAKREIQNKEEELKLSKTKIEELKNKLTESQKMLESNEQSKF